MTVRKRVAAIAALGLFTAACGPADRLLQRPRTRRVHAVAGGAGATAIAVLAGYAFARYAFPGHRLRSAALLGSLR